MRCFLLLAAVGLVPSLAFSEIHTLVPDVYYKTFSGTHPPVKRIQPGDTVRTKTLDPGGADEKSVVRDSKYGNSLTGPFYVEGAEPGDALAVRITRLRMNRNWGWTNYRLGSFSLPPKHQENMYPNRYKPDLVHKGYDNQVPWDLNVKANKVRLREPVSGRLKLEFPARPMLGCIGVAAPGDAAPDGSTSGSYGGNIDYNAIGEGATLILPVYHPGGLLYMGDAHALQGDGEPSGTGIETSMDVEFRAEVRKGVNLTGPRIETAEDLISVGSQREFSSQLDTALQMATADMVRWLVSEYDLEPWAAHLLISVRARYEVVTVAGSMALRISKRDLPTKR
jgi:amidase